MKSPWTVVSQGTAAGEAGLAAAFIRAARARGYPVQALGPRQYQDHLADAGAQLLTGDQLMEGARQSAVVVCATSFTCRFLMDSLRGAGRPLITLESSWFPWATDAKEGIAAVERFLVAMPAAVFRAGLGENEGRFAVDDEILDRVVPVGWFAPETVRQDGPPTVFLYFGRGYDPTRFACRGTLGAAIEQVAQCRPELQWRYLGPPNLPLPSCVEIHSSWVDETTMTRWHMDADLILCHHGQVTIGRAAAAGIRVLTLTHGTIFQPGAGMDWADFEVNAFARSGVVEAAYGKVPSDALARRIGALLDEGRGRPSGGGGAEAAVEVVEGIVSKR